MSRRALSTSLAIAATLGLGLAACASPAATAPTVTPSASDTPVPLPSPIAAPDLSTPEVEAALADLESRYDARVGLSVLDTGSGATLDHRADERFGYASSLKAFAAAALLDATDDADLDRVVTWTQADVDAAGYSPFTSQHVADGLPLRQLVEAAVRQSDNTALNLVLAELGGPAGLDAALAAQGDDVTDVVHTEPDLNTLTPGSTADTTTPAAFTATLARITAGDWLAADDRATLLDWMSGNATGDTLIRAGAPDGWQVADKSGGAGGIRDDVAIVTPPAGDPVVISVLTTRNDPAAKYDDALVAEAARIALTAAAAAR
ncbi:class A beta-lactamase [Frigoribacterium sp. VKM Ac-1396]|uniref:class A beta-lactamase n=1 Tax=Frigoribacterium sp. VKM Ac-1396 TaxID=2783821 RepID=UPI00188C507F|nr:class A beta-lactamase [Frigoribacterium sp. VKM Ac-1396]MBF4601802.1 class A beta-lactamase [Frigoribacterium sp. VKM Ac-1396]